MDDIAAKKWNKWHQTSQTTINGVGLDIWTRFHLQNAESASWSPQSDRIEPNSIQAGEGLFTNRLTRSFGFVWTKQHLILNSCPLLLDLQVGWPRSSTTEPPQQSQLRAGGSGVKPALCPDRCSDNIPNKTPLICAEMSPSAFCVLAFNFTKQKRAGGKHLGLPFLFSALKTSRVPPSHPLHTHIHTHAPPLFSALS